MPTPARPVRNSRSVCSSVDLTRGITAEALARRDADEEMAETIAEIYAESGQPDEEDRLWARRVLGLEP
jgi:hypothetical protein